MMVCGGGLAFLLGSGISCGAGLPSTGDITKDVFAAVDPARGSHDPGEQRALFAFLAALRRETRSYRVRLGRPSTFNYEDLYFLAASVWNSMVGEFDNPGLEPFIAKLQQTLGLTRFLNASRSPLWDGSGEDYSRGRLQYLATSACDVIEGVVVKCLLRTAPRPIDPHQMFRAATESDFSTIDIFTLNHDLLLEQALQESGVSVMDGFVFGRPELPAIRFWDPRSYDEFGVRVSYLKLHGSLDWWSYSMLLTGIAPPCKVEGDPDHVVDPRSGSYREWLMPPDRVLLIGTMNKLLMQARGDHFLDLLCLFRNRLRRCDRLVISGYGFGDKSINGVILDWVARPGNVCVWIVPSPLHTLRAARPAVAGFVRAGSRSQVKLIRAGFQDVTWADVQESFETPNSARELGWFKERL
jgi:hypothetical protein